MEQKTRRDAAQQPSGPRHQNATRRSTYARIDEKEVCDGVVAFRTQSSPNWYVEVKRPNQQPIRKTLKTADPKEAAFKALEYAAMLRSGASSAIDRRVPTVREAYEKLVAEKERRGCTEGTVTAYRNDLMQFVYFAEQRRIRQLSEVTPDVVSVFETKLKTEGARVPDERRKAQLGKPNKKTTVFGKIKKVKALFRFAAKMRWLVDNPIAGYDLPEKGKPDSYCFSASEVDLICNNCDSFFATLFRFLALTGLRQGELRWLTKNDVDLERRLIHIRAKRVGNRRWKPKGGDDRIVPLSSEAMKIAKMRLALDAESPWLFVAPYAPGVRDDQLRPCRLCGQLLRARKKAGLAKGKVHSFRHFFVSTMANNNVPAFKVMKMVGHKSLDIILLYYHAKEQELCDAIDAVDFGLKNENGELTDVSR